MGTKVCTKCGQVKPATTEYFYVRKAKKDGLTSECKTCLKTRANNYHYNNRNKQNEQSKKYYEQNKEKIAIKMKEYVKNNREKINEINNIYRKNNKEKVAEWQKKYAENNKDKISEHAKIYYQNKDKYAERRKQYHKTKKGKLICRINRQKRTARKNNLESTFTEYQWEECKKYFDNKCCYCGKESKLAQEHFIPLSKSGEYTKNNIIPACKQCNTSKHNKDFFEWYPKQSFYDKKREQKILKYLNYSTKTKIQQLALSI